MLVMRRVGGWEVPVLLEREILGQRGGFQVG